MSAFKGKEKFEAIFALPHKTKIMRKPQGIGAELKSLADGESGILLHLELMEGRERQAAKQFCDIYPSSIALTLRITSHYFGSNKTLHADSAFSSVATARALLSRGLHFMGCVKTARSAYPQKFLSMWAEPDDVLRGSHKTLKTTILLADDVTEANIFAVGWKDLKTKMIVCTRGITSVQGAPSIRHRRRLVETDYGHENDRYFLSIPRPSAIEKFFDCFSNIDVHDHYRQGSLALERNWGTKTWWHRLFASIFGMICTDAFLAYRFEYRNRQQGGQIGLISYKQFLFKLAHQLIHIRANNGIQLRRRVEVDAVEEDEMIHVRVN
jgi:hypothetical protein